MCRRHWAMVPRPLQRRLWAAYRSGQERTVTPSVEYLHVAAACVRSVAEQEGHDDNAIGFEVGLYESWADQLDEGDDA